MKTINLKLADIRLDSGTQCRGELNQDTVAEYAERMVAGDEFPPVDVFFDGSENHLADGFHRYMAAHRNKLVEIASAIRTGTAHDALWFGLGSNRRNGLRLSNGDKRRAVELALAKFPEKSQQEIADHVGCSVGYVCGIKKVIFTTENHTTTRKDSTGKNRPTAYKPRKSAEKLDPAPTEPEPPRIICGVPKPDPTPEQAKAQRDTENLAAFGEWAVELAAIDLALEDLKTIRDAIRSGEIESEQLRAAGANLEVTSRKFKTRAKAMTAE